MEEIKNDLTNYFTEIFKKNSYNLYDYFDFNIWFIKNNDDRCSNPTYFQELLSQTPTENDDIVKFLLIRSFIRSRNKNFKIKVEDFIHEVVEILVNLKEETKRLDKLISQYDAYETKNIIEQNLHYYDKFIKNQELMKSSLRVDINKIENIPKGEYKISLIGSFINTSSIFIDDYSDTYIKEDAKEYKLNHIIRVLDSDDKIVKSGEEEYFFYPNIEFYSYELKNKDNKYDSGTNLLYFVIKIENLNNSRDEAIISIKKPILDVFLSNIKSLLNNFKKVKILETDVKAKDANYDLNINLKISAELDAWTLSSLYGKITDLLQNMISYKVLVDHKFKTIMNYFPEMVSVVEDLFQNKDKAKNDSCILI
jgi:hypothetical protein